MGRMTKLFLYASFEKPSLNGRWSYILTMPVFLLFFSYLLVGSAYFSNLKTFIGATALNGLILTTTFFIQNHVAEIITKRYAGLHLTLKRISISIMTHAFLSAVFLLIIAGIYVKYRFFGSEITYGILLNIYLINLGAIILVTGIRETFYSLDHWKHHEVNKERLRKENVQGQLQSLKAQVSPHFLFNSLNSLSTLISEEPEKAEQFVEQMAKVYRYLLQTNQNSDTEGNSDELTTLENELIFIESYYHLLKTRYGEGMHLAMDTDEKFRLYRLPPLTLQLLVENAVKHNVIRASRPLTVHIEIMAGGLLRVRNNLQKKSVSSALNKMESTQVGLSNIQAKYLLLSESNAGIPEPVIENGPDDFTVTLPLIPPITATI
ncbi:histidine kinase [Dyadobacter sediminis]|nr:histidine kinase [Dyadobacter sediminis]